MIDFNLVRPITLAYTIIEAIYILLIVNYFL